MPSTYNNNLRLEIIATGEQSGTWGQTTNNNLGTLIVDAITGKTSITSSSSPYTLTAINGAADESRAAALELNCTGANFQVIVPTVTKLYVVENVNATDSVTVKTASGSGVTVPPLKSVLVRCDGTDVVEQLNYIAGNFEVNGSTNFNGGFNVDDFSASGSVELGTTQSATISVASPAVVTVAASFDIDTPIAFNTTGVLPTGISGDTIYYVLATGWTSTSFRISTSIGGTAVNTTAVGSGTHSVHTVVSAPTAFAGTSDTQVATTAFATSTALSGGKYTGAIDYATPVTIASAATTDIGAADSNVVNITGTTTITSFGTASSGTTRVLTFAGSLTLTYNATSLILPGSVNIVTQAGDVGVFQSLGSGNWQCVSYTPRVIQYALKNVTYLTSGTNATYTTPTSVRALKVTVVAGGGGGGGVDGAGASTYAASAGGAGGGWAEALITSVESTYTYTVGNGGAGGAAGNNNGAAGGASEFKNSGSTVVISATGGAGGSGDLGSSSSSAIGAVGGLGSLTGVTGLIGAGVSSTWSRVTSGTYTNFSASGGSKFGGGSIVSAQPGTNARVYGEGGGSTYSGASTSNYAGGNGFQGVIIVEEYY